MDQGTEMDLSIAGVVEAGWNLEADDRPRPKLLMDGEEHEPTETAIFQFGLRCVNALQSHEDAAAFVEAVKAEEVPDYYDVIKVRSPSTLVSPPHTQP